MAKEGPTIIAECARDINTFTIIDKRPQPEPEPISFNVRSPEINFAGRSNELLHLYNVMQTSSNSTTSKPHTIIVSGLGGIGKTQLIRKFIDINRTSYKNVIWINSERSETINDSFKRLAEDRLSIPITHADGRERDLNSIVEHVVDKLFRTKTLFVFDNVDEIESIKFMLTMEASGKTFHIIVTSRIQEWGDEINILQLKVWELDHAIEYVSKTLKDPENLHKDSEEDKKSLVDKLQYFPLALRQATAHINHQRKNRLFEIADYVTKYDSQEMLDSTFFQKVASNIYEKTTFTTWRVTIDAIERDGATGKLAVRILYIISHFDPEHIQRDIFIHLTYEPESGFVNFVLNKLRWLQLRREEEIDHEESVMSAVRLLVNYSMVDSQKHQSILSIHRLVQQVIKLELAKTKDQGRQILRDGLSLVLKLIKVEKINENHRHAISVFLSALKFHDLVKQFPQIPDEILASLITCGNYNQAKEFGDTILEPMQSILGEDHLVMILTRFRIAKSYFKKGMYTDALRLYQEVFEKQKILLGDDHPNTLTSLSDIASSHRQLGKHTVALEIYEQLLKKQTNILGQNHLHTLTTTSNIAFSYKLLGKYTEALQMFEDNFEKQKQFLGEDHAETHTSKSIIASLYRDLGKHTEALQMFQEIFEKQKNILGEDHPLTLATRSNIAFSHKELGNHNKALEMFQEIFEKQKTILGEHHPDTVTSMSDIAYLYRELGKDTEALLMYEEVFEKDKTILGEDHPDTLTSKSDVAYLYRQLGRQNEALQMFQEIFEKEKIILGEHHPGTLITEANIASSHREMGKHTEAIEMFQDIFEKQKNILGEDHPNILTIKNHLAFSYVKVGRHTEALKMYEDVFGKRLAILGEDHPDTIKSKSNVDFLREEVRKLENDHSDAF